jgi:hypothetical protein
VNALNISLIVPMGRSVLISPSQTVAVVRLRGQIDAGCLPVLTHTARQLSLLEPQTVFVDLESVTTAHPPLTGFLAGLPALLPQQADLLLCKANSAVRELIALHCPQLLNHLHDAPAPFGGRRPSL